MEVSIVTAEFVEMTNKPRDMLTDEEKLILEVRAKINDVEKNFVRVVEALYKLKGYYETRSYLRSHLDFIDAAEKYFGMKKSTAYGLVKVYTDFFLDEDDSDKYSKFSFSQLVAMSALSNKNTLEFIPCTMTVKDIKDLNRAWNKFGYGYSAFRDWNSRNPVETVKKFREWEALREQEKADKPKKLKAVKAPDVIELASDEKLTEFVKEYIQNNEYTLRKAGSFTSKETFIQGLISSLKESFNVYEK